VTLTFCLSPWTTVLIEKLKVPQVVKEY